MRVKFMFNSSNSHNRYRDDYIRYAQQALKAVWVLIALNVIFYIVNLPDSCALWSNNLPEEMALFYQSKYHYSIYSFRPYQLVTYMFMHGGFMHLFFNMYGLYLFGGMVAPALGRRRFLALYFIGGITGALLHMLANWNSVPPIPAVGASGALFGVMMAAAMIRPNVEMFIMFIPVPVKLKTLVVVYAIVEILSNGRTDNIAHLAHLGGFVGAYIFVMLFCKREVAWHLGDLFRGKGVRSSSGSTPPPPPQDPQGAAGGSQDNTANAPHWHIEKVSQQEVDRLLDKISREGINSLSDYERAELQFFREQMQSHRR